MAVRNFKPKKPKLCLIENNEILISQKNGEQYVSLETKIVIISIWLNVMVCQCKFLCYDNNMFKTWPKHVLFFVIINFESNESLPLNCGSLTVHEIPMKVKKKEEYDLLGIISYLCLPFSL